LSAIEHLVEQKQAARKCAVAVIAEGRYLSHVQPSGMIRSLQAMGHSVRIIEPDDQALEAGENAWASGIDLAIARGRSWGVLCLLEWLERRGVPSINSRAAISAVHNKAEMTVALASAGIATPRTWLGSLARVVERIPPGDYPVIVKPIFGDNCRGLEIVHDAEQLCRLPWPDSIAIVQKFFPGMDSDLKLYCIGREVWAVRKPSPLAMKLAQPGEEGPAELVPVTSDLRSLALRCGDIFHLELYGVDCIETEQGALVIEVNEFPNYSAVPDADEKLSNFVLTFAKQERTI
jgi:ribosomal protein S6--L-glutamate ligase